MQRAIAVIQTGLGASCPAQTLVEKAISNAPSLYYVLGAAMKALDDKFANVLSPQSEQDILDELRDLTDEHLSVNQRAVE